MKGRSSKAWVHRGYAAAGRSSDSSFGKGGMSLVQYDRKRRETMIGYSKMVFSRFPGLSKTGQLVGDGVKYLAFYYPLSERLVCTIQLSENTLMPMLSGPANEVESAVKWLLQKRPELIKGMRVDEPRQCYGESLKNMGTHTVRFSGTFFELETWAPFLQALDYAVTQKKRVA